MTTGTLLTIQVGRVVPLAIEGQFEMSGIRKTTVAGPVEVRALGLAGDEQADLSAHGGLAKAVYAYPIEHYEYWRQQQAAIGRSAGSLPHGIFGENLTIGGLLETDVYVGDVLRFPGCVLRVTQPRTPCYKFNAVMGDPQASRRMLETGFCGFYLAVDEPGTIEAGQAFEVVPGSRETPITALMKRVKNPQV
jgi:MOSC domain-containing protein YiiM